MQAKAQEILLRLQTDPKFYIESLLWIKTKKRKIERFKFNAVQQRVYKVIEKLREAGKPIRIIFLKARQTGISTLTEGLIFQDTATHPNVTSLVIAHNKESTAHIFKMSKMFWDRMDVDFRPMRQYSNKIEVSFDNSSETKRKDNPGLGSSIRVDTANNPNAFRGFTGQNLHCSELAFWEKPDDVMLGLLQAIPAIPESIIVIESTANGAGGYFYHMWKDAKAGENDFTPIFVPWYEDPEYRKELPHDFKLLDMSHPIYGNELKLKERYKLDDRQIWWRRWYIKNYCNNDPLKFKQEYPITDVEAFVSTGSNVFDADTIEDYRKYTKPAVRGEFVESDKGIEFEERTNGKWRIWKKPEEGNRYVMGTDVAEGLAEGNFSCIDILDKKNIEQVAQYHGHIKPEILAIELKKAGLYYNGALAGVENNNHGATTLGALKKIYFRIYYQRGFDKRVNKPTSKIGWHTNRKTKPLMIDKLEKSLRKKEIIINSSFTLDELAEYVEKVDPDTHNVKMGAAGQGYDDRVVSLAIANIIWDFLPLNINEKRVEYEPANIITGY